MLGGDEYLLCSRIRTTDKQVGSTKEGSSR
jgi:hypothetical protein